MTIQGITQIADIIRNAVVFNIKNWPGAPSEVSMNSDSLLQSIEGLFALLDQRNIDYVLVGGIALLHYVDGRNTQDIDLIMTMSTLEKLPELKITSQDLNFTRANYGELQIDILLTQNPLFKKVHDSYTTVQKFMDKEISIATVEGLLLLKLYALPSLYRQGNFAKVGIYENDVATLTHYYKPNLPGLLDELSEFLSESDLSEIRNIVGDIQKRLQRFENGSGPAGR